MWRRLFSGVCKFWDDFKPWFVFLAVKGRLIWNMKLQSAFPLFQKPKPSYLSILWLEKFSFHRVGAEFTTDIDSFAKTFSRASRTAGQAQNCHTLQFYDLMSLVSESRWWYLIQKEVKSRDSRTWFRNCQFQTSAWKPYLQMLLLAERFVFWEWWSGFSGSGCQDPSHATNVACQLVNKFFGFHICSLSQKPTWRAAGSLLLGMCFNRFVSLLSSNSFSYASAEIYSHDQPTTTSRVNTHTKSQQSVPALSHEIAPETGPSLPRWLTHRVAVCPNECVWRSSSS